MSRHNILTLEQMMQQLRTVEMDLRERGHDATVSALNDLCDIVESLVVREAARVPLPMDTEPWPKPPIGPMRYVRMVEGRTPTLHDLSDDEIDRLFPRDHAPAGRYYYIRRDYELYQPVPEQPMLFAIRRKAGI